MPEMMTTVSFEEAAAGIISVAAVCCLNWQITAERVWQRLSGIKTVVARDTVLWLSNVAPPISIDIYFACGMFLYFRLIIVSCCHYCIVSSLMAGCLQLWKTWKTWKSQGICSFWKTQGKLREFKIYSGNLSDAVFCDAICLSGIELCA